MAVFLFSSGMSQNGLGLKTAQFENLGSAEISAEPIFLPFHAELKWWEV